jgi:hypothetical protein
VSLDPRAILDAAKSHAEGLGIFEEVMTHEPKSSPGAGLRAAMWVQDIGPVPAGSGLAQTSARLAIWVRIYQNMLAEPQDLIDPDVLDAVSALMGAYSGDFDLGGLVRNVDLLAAAGEPLMARAGYINQDGTLHRVMTVTLPLIVNDAWTQEA